MSAKAGHRLCCSSSLTSTKSAPASSSKGLVLIASPSSFGVSADPPPRLNLQWYVQWSPAPGPQQAEAAQVGKPGPLGLQQVFGMAEGLLNYTRLGDPPEIVETTQPDRNLGERVCAAVIFAGDPITLAELNAHLDERGVAAHARPDMLVAMAALPTTPIGKVDKKAIARQISGPAGQ